jgi:hypothetical protein
LNRRFFLLAGDYALPGKLGFLEIEEQSDLDARDI